MLTMRSLEKLFPAFFGTGLIALAGSMAYSSIYAGSLFASHPFITILRAFGIGLMAAGATLWVGLCRHEAGKPSFDPLFGLLVVGGSALLLVSLLMPTSVFSPYLMWTGLALNGAAIVIGAAVMLVDPAYPSHLATTWPDGGLLHSDPHVPAIDLHRPEYLGVEPDDLTRIQGIGLRLQSALNQSGIDTYHDLLRHTPDELAQIVRDAHLRAPIDPASWCRQAQKLIDNK